MTRVRGDVVLSYPKLSVPDQSKTESCRVTPLANPPTFSADSLQESAAAERNLTRRAFLASGTDRRLGIGSSCWPRDLPCIGAVSIRFCRLPPSA